MDDKEQPNTITWSPECSEVFAAAAKAQASMGPLTANKTAEIKSPKGNFEYSYAGLPDTLAACLHAYTAQGIYVAQPVATFDNGVEVRTALLHSSGQWIKSPRLFVGLRSAGAQDIGSAITYARRYSLQGMVGLSPADGSSGGDDDGGGAQGNKPDRWEPPREPERRTSRREPAQPTLREQVIAQVDKVSRGLELDIGAAWRECLAAAELPDGLGGDDGPGSDDVSDRHLAALLRASHEVLSAGVTEPGPPGAP